MLCQPKFGQNYWVYCCYNLFFQKKSSVSVVDKYSYKCLPRFPHPKSLTCFLYMFKPFQTLQSQSNQNLIMDILIMISLGASAIYSHWFTNKTSTVWWNTKTHFNWKLRKKFKKIQTLNNFTLKDSNQLHSCCFFKFNFIFNFFLLPQIFWSMSVATTICLWWN